MTKTDQRLSTISEPCLVLQDIIENLSQTMLQVVLLHRCLKCQETREAIWTTGLESEFQNLKTTLANDVVLHSPDYSLPFVLETDASGRGIDTQSSTTKEERSSALLSNAT